MKLAIFTLLAAAALNAQWLRYATPGVPRLANGRPDLTAATPATTDGHPDLSGTWAIRLGAIVPNFVRDWKAEEIQSTAEALHRERMENLGRDSPTTLCLPMGPLSNVAPNPDGFKLIQTPELIVFLYPNLEFRQIFLDGRSLELEPNPSWTGYSVGRWDGDTLVVESNGFNDRSWLDFEGHPHSEHLRMTERFRRTDFGHLEFSTTFEDPEVYARPIRVATTAQVVVDTGMIEYVCNENEKDAKHLIGSASDDPSVKLAPDMLAKYVGTYHLAGFGPIPLPLQVVRTGEGLSVDHPLFGRTEMRAISSATFSAFGTVIEFAESDGKMTLTFRTVEGDLTATRAQ